jgi:predicted Zn-dependent peptidase
MKYTKKVLKNGLRVIAIPLKDSTTVTVLVMVETGSKYETKEINGLSHFLEHMCFKGTLNRPRSIDITHELDSIGAEYNAFTGQEYTGYYAKSHPKHFTRILDVVSDLYLNPLLEEKEIEKEKGVVIEEINMYEDNPSRKIHEYFEALLYGDQPAGWPITGTKESVQLLRRDQIADYRHKHYVSKATTVIVAGSFDVKHVFKAVAEKFADMATKPQRTKLKVKESQTKPAIFLKQKDSEQTHLLLGVRSFPITHKLVPTLQVLNAVLGGGMSSRLWQRIREEMGVAYYVYATSDFATDHGYFAVGAGVDNNRVPEVIATVMEELRRLLQEKITEKDLQKAKDYIIGKMYLNLESSD